jgi:hypothetical protein
MFRHVAIVRLDPLVLREYIETTQQGCPDQTLFHYILKELLLDTFCTP